MTQFIVLYTAPEDAWSRMASATPEEAKLGMEAWMAWAGKAGDAIVDMGTPLGRGSTLTSEGAADSSSEVCGYTILEAESRDAAISILEGHPHFMTPGSCTIEVLESLPLPGSGQ